MLVGLRWCWGGIYSVSESESHETVKHDRLAALQPRYACLGREAKEKGIIGELLQNRSSSFIIFHSSFTRGVLISVGASIISSFCCAMPLHTVRTVPYSISCFPGFRGDIGKVSPILHRRLYSSATAVMHTVRTVSRYLGSTNSGISSTKVGHCHPSAARPPISCLTSLTTAQGPLS